MSDRVCEPSLAIVEGVRVSSVLTREAAPRRRKEQPTELLCTTHQEGQSVRCSLITGIEIRIRGNLALGLSFLAPAESAEDSLATVPNAPYGPQGLIPCHRDLF